MVFTVVSKGSILGLLPFNKNQYFFNQSSKLQCKKGKNPIHFEDRNKIEFTTNKFHYFIMPKNF